MSCSLSRSAAVTRSVGEDFVSAVARTDACAPMSAHVGSGGFAGARRRTDSQREELAEVDWAVHVFMTHAGTLVSVPWSIA